MGFEESMVLKPNAFGPFRKVFVNLSTIDCNLLRSMIQKDWFGVENWFLMVQLLGNSFIPGLLKSPNKELSIRLAKSLVISKSTFRHLFTMHRALAKSESLLVNENGEIDADQVKDYVSNFATSRPPNESFQVLIGQYSKV